MIGTSQATSGVVELKGVYEHETAPLKYRFCQVKSSAIGDLNAYDRRDRNMFAIHRGNEVTPLVLKRSHMPVLDPSLLVTK